MVSGVCLGGVGGYGGGRCESIWSLDGLKRVLLEVTDMVGD